jgi:hypothetical protein
MESAWRTRGCAFDGPGPDAPAQHPILHEAGDEQDLPSRSRGDTSSCFTCTRNLSSIFAVMAGGRAASQWRLAAIPPGVRQPLLPLQEELLRSLPPEGIASFTELLLRTETRATAGRALTNLPTLNPDVCFTTSSLHFGSIPTYGNWAVQNNRCLIREHPD